MIGCLAPLFVRSLCLAKSTVPTERPQFENAQRRLDCEGAECYGPLQRLDKSQISCPHDGYYPGVTARYKVAAGI
jgi:hypothetical protein